MGNAKVQWIGKRIQKEAMIWANAHRGGFRCMLCAALLRDVANDDGMTQGVLAAESIEGHRHRLLGTHRKCI